MDYLHHTDEIGYEDKQLGLAITILFLVFLAHVALSVAFGFIYGAGYGLIFFAVVCLLEVIYLEFIGLKNKRKHKENK